MRFESQTVFVPAEDLRQSVHRMAAAESNEVGPIPISRIANRYLLFSIEHVIYLRKEHRICGVLVGGIPQAPQQNVFHGLPMELMAEEAQLMVEKGIGYIVDDAIAHRAQNVARVPIRRKQEYLRQMREEGRQIADQRAALKEEARARSIEKARASGKLGARRRTSQVNEGRPSNESDDDTLFSTSQSDVHHTSHQSQDDVSSTVASTRSLKPIPDATFGITPTTSRSLVHPGTHQPHHTPSMIRMMSPPPSYSLFKHLNDHGFYIYPGLRFGCQYLVYPGDPLRFHSHFLATHVGWNEEIDLMKLVGGGRLGTGVKKAWLIGGREEEEEEDEEGETVVVAAEEEEEEEEEGKDEQRRKNEFKKEEDDGDRPASASASAAGSCDDRISSDRKGPNNNNNSSTRMKVRTFSIEWAAM